MYVYIHVHVHLYEHVYTEHMTQLKISTQIPMINVIPNVHVYV